MAPSKSLDYAAFAEGEPLPVPVISTGAAAQVLTVSSTSAQSQALSSTVVIFSTTVPLHLAWGDNPTADATCMVIPAGLWTLPFDAKVKLAVKKITGGADGVASIVPAMGG